MVCFIQLLGLWTSLNISINLHSFYQVCPRGIIVKSMDCKTIVSEFKLQLQHYVHFRAITLGKGMKPLILPAMGYIVPLLIFLKDVIDIK